MELQIQPQNTENPLNGLSFDLEISNAYAFKCLIKMFKEVSDNITFYINNSNIYIVKYNTVGVILESNLQISNLLQRDIKYNDKPLGENIWIKFSISSSNFESQLKSVKSTKKMTLILSKKQGLNTIYVKSGTPQNGLVSIDQDYSNIDVVSPVFKTSEDTPLCVELVENFVASIKSYKGSNKISLAVANNYIAFSSALCDNGELKTGNLYNIGTLFEGDTISKYYIDDNIVKILCDVNGIVPNHGVLKFYFENDILKIIFSIGDFGLAKLYIKCNPL